MKVNRLRLSLFAVLLGTLLLSGRASAQAPLEPAQLPSLTMFYLLWRGTPPPDARKANSLLALWDDPGFAPVRSAMFENVMSGSEKNPAKQPLSREEVEQYSSLLENAFVAGWIAKPEAKMTASAVPPKPATSWNGFFLVYDRTGKEELLSKAVMRLRSQEKDPPQISQVTVGDVPALKVERKTSTTYWVEHGKYAASANERYVLEEIIARLEGKSAAGPSLAQSATYKEAQPQLGGGVVEFFLRISDLKNLFPDAGTAAVKLGPALEALKFEAVHSISGRVVLEGSKTRFQGGVLGDAVPGTLFDLWGDGQQSPASLALLPPGAISYSATQFNLLGFYEILKRAMTAVLPPGQQGNASMLESLAQSRLGMPLPDALGLFSGEFASLQTSPSIDPQKAVYVLAIRKKPETLKLVRTIFSDQLSSERAEGDTTFVKISLRGGQGGAGVAQWNFYHLAVTPDFILGAQRSETLHDLLAQRSAVSAGAAVTVPPQLRAARAGHPEKLNSLYYFDFQKVDWPATKERWLEESKKASATKSTAVDPSKDPAMKARDLLSGVDPQAFPRHLHVMAGVGWKDAKGVHFDQWLE